MEKMELDFYSFQVAIEVVFPQFKTADSIYWSDVTS
jgi:hypothetical protein